MILHFQFTPESLSQYQAAFGHLQGKNDDPVPNEVYLYRLIPLNTIVVGIIAQNMWIGFLSAALFTGAHFFTREWYQARARKKGHSPEMIALATKPWQLELKGESISLKSEDTFQEFALRNYRGLEETTNFLFLAFADGSYIGFPKSAFSTAGEQEAFRESLKIHTPHQDPSVAW